MRLFWILFLCCPLGLLAQTDTTTTTPGKRQHELALNFTFFVKQFIDFGGNTFTVSPYAISYKYIGGKNHSFRTGLGMDYSNSNEDADDPDLTDRKSTTVLLNYRAGYEYRIRLAKKWSMFAGFDALLNIDNTKTYTKNQFQIVDIKRQGFSAGGGPIVGVQVHFNDRISLFTESAFYFTTGSQKVENVFTEPGSGLTTKEESNTNTTDLNIELPTSVYLAVRLFKK